WVTRLADIVTRKGRRLSPGTRPAIEDVRAELADLGQHRRPGRSDIICVIMRRATHRALDETAQRGARDPFGLAPCRRLGTTIEGAVADKRELADRGRIVLVDDAAYRLGERRMAKPVEDDLRDRAAAFHRLISSLVIDGLSQAQQRPPLVERFAGRNDEGTGGNDRG